ncbi:beta-porphyranase D [Zobellia sp. OII3]|uniref:family 16 glycosylhydrolase n=1 Tax=Zobellia sp. OII3 TaxID=2034520 RepID=UPI000B52FA5F|nr:family 16 glycosylhydrolase [Zobellia sp. OII3]OWW24095.1 beta-porphyranase D [Zobellia sp. OII3]
MILKQAILTLVLVNASLFAQDPPKTYSSTDKETRQGPPKPPMGKRWVLNPDFSDEFNGTELDTTKWLDHHPTWIGRAPGLFMSSQVSVGDGFLKMEGKKLEKDTIVHAYGKDITFNIAGAAVVSKKATKFGYYECRVKAAATTMSTTFWFSSSNNFKGPKDCDRYGLEWDIHESIGREGDFNGSYFASGMHSNAHFWYTDCNGKKYDHRAPQVKFEDAKLTSEDFNVYGGWWRDESTASYYYNNRPPKHQKFYDKVKKKPFDQPMYMRLVNETYPFPWIELPNAEELSDPSKNTVYYDWVRAYRLVDVNDPNSEVEKDPTLKLYHENVTFPSATIEHKRSKSLEIPLSYQANEDREIAFILFDNEGKKIKEAILTAYAGYANLEYTLQLDQKLPLESPYKLSAHIRPLKGNKKNSLDESTVYIHLTK